MRRFVSFFSVFIVFSNAYAGDSGLPKIAFIAAVAEKCQLKLNAETKDWLDFLASDVSDEDIAPLRELGDTEFAKDVEAKGFIGACFDARSTLYREGFLTATPAK